MQALVFTRPGTVELQEVPDPVPGGDEVLVRVDSVGICGSELHGITAGTLRRPPLIMGHEFSGTLADGTRVVVNPLISCGTCDLCRIGSEHLCRVREIIGIQRPGAFAERVAVPRSALHVLPDDLTLPQAAMIEPLANAVHVMASARPAGHARVGIIGSGAIGISCLLAALEYTDDVVVSDIAEHRLSVAQKLGARLTAPELRGEFDVIVDAVGAAATHHDSVARLRPGGTAVWIGLLDASPGFDAQEFVREEKRILSSYCYTRADFAGAIELAGRVDLDWVTCVPLANGEQIFSELLNGRRDLVKVLLRP